MKVITKNLSKSLDYVNVYALADWHIGDEGCKIDDIRSHVQRIKEDDRAVVVCNGDLINCATRHSVSDVFSATMNPQQQINTVASILEPIKDKIIGVCSGNHEERVYKDTGVDATACICSMLGILDVYASEGGLIFLRFGSKKHRQNEDRRQCYSIYFTHGTGGGRKEGAKAIRLADMAAIIDADVYIHSHTHLGMIMKISSYRTTPCSNSVQLVDKLFVNTASKLEYGGYGQRFEFKPASTPSILIRLSGIEREMQATME